MEPSLQYTSTTDGVRIAYTVAGAGPALVRMTGGLWDHAQGYWRIGPMRRQIERLAGHFTHIQYDARGTGMSQRGVFDFSLEAQLRDLEAVVAANQAAKVNILAHFTGGMAAIAYAARNPDKVSKLVLLRPHLRGSDYFNDRVMRALATYRRMAAEDWDGYLSTVTNRSMRFERPDIAREMTAVYNESMTPDTIRQFEEQYVEIDVSEYPAKVEAPTLIVVESGSSGFSGDEWREVAATIPNVSLVMVRAAMPLAFTDEATDAILSFLGEEGEEGRSTRDTGSLQVVVHFSIGRPGKDYEATLREMTRSRGAQRFEASGDGYLASFRSAQMALQTASDVQQAFTDQGVPAELRIGIDAIDQTAAGQPKASAERAVIAARAAAPGEVLVTDLVRQLMTGKGFLFAMRLEPLDQRSEEPLTVYELRWRR